MSHCQKFLLQENQFSWKIYLKNSYFSVSLDMCLQKCVRFLWSRNLYKLLCLCFGLGPAPKVFTKLLKIPITILGRMNTRLIIDLADILLIEKQLLNRGALIFLLQEMGLVIKPREFGFRAYLTNRIFRSDWSLYKWLYL